MMIYKILGSRDFAGSPVVRTSSSSAAGRGSVPGWGIKIPHAVQCGQKKKKKRMPLPLDVVSEHYFIFLEHSFKKEKLKTPQKK